MAADRPETPAQRADRNWTELTQELRVTQTGVQILTAFLLILPFQQRFGEVTPGQRVLYLCLIGVAIVTTVLMVTPVSLHRFLFHRGRKIDLVRIGNRITDAALLSLALLIIGTVAFVFDFVVGPLAAWIAAPVTAVMLFCLWALLPWRVRTELAPDPLVPAGVDRSDAPENRS